MFVQELGPSIEDGLYKGWNEVVETLLIYNSVSVDGLWCGTISLIKKLYLSLT